MTVSKLRPVKELLFRVEGALTYKGKLGILRKVRREAMRVGAERMRAAILDESFIDTSIGARIIAVDDVKNIDIDAALDAEGE